MKWIQPDPKSDILVLQEEIDFDIENAPTLNLRTGQLESFSRFHYIVKLYKKNNGDQYYLFSHFNDCTLFIMNCNKAIYDVLETMIPLNDNIAIFEHSESDKNMEFVPIPEEYRHDEDPSGTTVIFTD